MKIRQSYDSFEDTDTCMYEVAEASNQLVLFRSDYLSQFR